VTERSDRRATSGAASGRGDRDERQRLEERLRADAESFRDLVDAAPVAIVTLNRKLRVTRWNAAAVRLFQWTEAEVLNQPLPFVPEEKKQEFQALLTTVPSGPLLDFETYRRRKDGSYVQVAMSAVATHDAAGEMLELHGFFVDLSERWRHDASLRSSLERLEAIGQPTRYVLWDWDLRTGVVWWGAGFEAATGLTPAPEHQRIEWLVERLHADDRQPFAATIAAALEGAADTGAAEIRFAEAGGSLRTFLSRCQGSQDRQGRVVRIVGLLIDVSDRRRVEEVLRESHGQLRALSARLLGIREEERTRIARELHDELGQALTGMKMQLSALGARPPKDPRLLRRKLAGLAELIDETVDAVRRISTELRPAVLDQLGLTAGLEWQLADFAQRTGIRSGLAASVEDRRVSSALATAIFRIVQEALTNVARHSGARQVLVRLAEEDGQLVLEVNDDGVGIAGSMREDDLTLGLLGIRERAAALGGRAEVGGTPGAGTSVRVKFPAGAEAWRSEERPEP
jgi:two-component system sensor histidine kinase UhpB